MGLCCGSAVCTRADRPFHVHTGFFSFDVPPEEFALSAPPSFALLLTLTTWCSLHVRGVLDRLSREPKTGREPEDNCPTGQSVGWNLLSATTNEQSPRHSDVAMAIWSISESPV